MYTTRLKNQWHTLHLQEIKKNKCISVSQIEYKKRSDYKVLVGEMIFAELSKTITLFGYTCTYESVRIKLIIRIIHI